MLKWLKEISFGFVIWLVFWAVVSAGLLVMRPFSVWRLAGETWFGVVCVYLVLYVLGTVVVICVGWTDVIKNQWLKFFVVMLICFLIAAVICLAIALFTI